MQAINNLATTAANTASAAATTASALIFGESKDDKITGVDANNNIVSGTHSSSVTDTNSVDVPRPAEGISNRSADSKMTGVESHNNILGSASANSVRDTNTADAHSNANIGGSNSNTSSINNKSSSNISNNNISNNNLPTDNTNTNTFGTDGNNDNSNTNNEDVADWKKKMPHSDAEREKLMEKGEFPHDPNDHSGEPLKMHDAGHTPTLNSDDAASKSSSKLSTASSTSAVSSAVDDNDDNASVSTERDRQGLSGLDRKMSVGQEGGDPHGGNKGTGTQYVKSTGLAADGGNFDAKNPGAVTEAHRLLDHPQTQGHLNQIDREKYSTDDPNEPELSKTGSHGRKDHEHKGLFSKHDKHDKSSGGAHTDQANDGAVGGEKVSTVQKIKDKLHIHH